MRNATIEWLQFNLDKVELAKHVRELKYTQVFLYSDPTNQEFNPRFVLLITTGWHFHLRKAFTDTNTLDL